MMVRFFYPQSPLADLCNDLISLTYKLLTICTCPQKGSQGFVRGLSFIRVERNKKAGTALNRTPLNFSFLFERREPLCVSAR